MIFTTNFKYNYNVIVKSIKNAVIKIIILVFLIFD